MKRGSTKSHSLRLLWLVMVGALVASTASCEFFYRLLNRPPEAGFTVGPSTVGAAPLAVTVSAATSSDPDENIEDYAWDFGDGTTGSGATAPHTYSAVGTYTIVLTVTDKYGETDTATKTVSVIPAETGPTASFNASPTSGSSPLTVAFDASGSSYPDGTIQSYSWEFGDGSYGYGVSVWHTYSTSTGKSCVVKLTVRATDGETTSATKTITVSAPGSPTTPTTGAPSAQFAVTPTLGVAPLQVKFDPKDSEADEGRTLIKFIWSYGDNDSAWDIDPNVMTHVYTTDTTSETFAVTLIVLDNEADTDSITKNVKAYNHRPVAGFEIGNPEGGDGGGGLLEYINPQRPLDENLDSDPENGDEWIADDVTYGRLGGGVQTVSVVIRSKRIPDNRWRALTATANQADLKMADLTSAVSSSTPATPTGYAAHNYSYDPEGQEWATALPTWFPNQAWGVKYLYINWGDGSAEQQVEYDDFIGQDIVVYHPYDFSGSGAVTRTITVTAEDWLGYKSAAFSRILTLKEGAEGTNDI